MNNGKLANPAPLGLLAFGMTTILLNIHSAGFYPLSSVILSMALFFGGSAQILTCIFEFRRGNTFGLTAFGAFGFFWIVLGFIWVLPKMGWAEPTPPGFMGCFSLLWAVFGFFMFLGTLPGGTRVQKFIFAVLTLLYTLLAIHGFTGIQAIGALSGWVGIVLGSAALYQAMAEVLAEQYGRNVLPY